MTEPSSQLNNKTKNTCDKTKFITAEHGTLITYLRFIVFVPSRVGKLQKRSGRTGFSYWTSIRPSENQYISKHYVTRLNNEDPFLLSLVYSLEVKKGEHGVRVTVHILHRTTLQVVSNRYK